MRMKTFIGILIGAVALASASPLDITARVVGGEDAKIEDSPFQISITLPLLGHFCGGSIISEQWIVTAAHCVSRPFTRFDKIIVGTSDLNKRGTIYKREKIIIHPDYNKPPFNNDIALIKVSQPIRFTENVQKIRISNNTFGVGVDVTITGWGLLGATGPTTKILQTVDLKTISNEECVEKLTGITNFVGEGNVCAFREEGKGVCAGDSGGPLFTKTSSGEFELVGVVSWGVPCGIGFPDGFARISYYYDWIIEVMKQHS